MSLPSPAISKDPILPPDLQRLLVVLPNWVGDVALASPVLAALRARWPAAQIVYLLRGYVREVIDGCGWHDACVEWPAHRGWRREWRTLALGRRLRDEPFDAALLLTNSFRAALLARWARIPRRVGYARDGRAWLLTHRVVPERAGGRFVPAPITPYYAKLAGRLGCPVDDLRLRLGVSPEQERSAARARAAWGLSVAQPYAVVNPGAAFGAAKCWPAERFAELCDRLGAQEGLSPVLVGAPGERPLLSAIERAAKRPVLGVDPAGLTLGGLKALIRDAALLVCNDTGPRHFGVAFSRPTVTIFGPTDPRWTETGSLCEIPVRVSVPCGPCQLPRCPLDHRCMTGVTTDMVMDAVRRVLRASHAGAPAAGRLPLFGAASA